MTVDEAQENFKAQSIALTGHKNIVLNSDFYKIYGGSHLVYRRIKTRSDWFVVKAVTTGHPYYRYSPNVDTVSEIKIIKVSFKLEREFNVANVWEDYNRIIADVDPTREWKASMPYLTRPMPEHEIINLLETSIFRHYEEDTDPTSSEFQSIHLCTY